MSLITRSFKPKQILQLCRILNVSQSKQCHWYPDYKPGPYPKTKEEWDACAKKYNLLPEEYEPHEDDGSGSGDYPKIPIESVDSKDPYYIYDDERLRRDYLEPVPREFMLLNPELMTIDSRRPTAFEANKVFLTASAVCFFVLYLMSLFTNISPVAEKQYPKKGPHYTFELDRKEGEVRRRKARIDECLKTV